MANFIVEFTHDITLDPEVETQGEQNQDNDFVKWMLFIDESFNQNDYGVGLVLQPPLDEQMEYVVRIRFKAINNEAEYEALVAGSRDATKLGVESLDVFNDSCKNPKFFITFPK